MDFREWLISKDLPFESREGNLVFVPEEELIPYYDELTLLFPGFFTRDDNIDEIPHRV